MRVLTLPTFTLVSHGSVHAYPHIRLYYRGARAENVASTSASAAIDAHAHAASIASAVAATVVVANAAAIISLLQVTVRVWVRGDDGEGPG